MILTLLLILAVSCAEKPESPRPNILFILVDDMGYGDLSCYGQELFETPNIDKLALEGMRFTSSYAGCTVCAPSRSVLMTGQHTGHTRIRGNMCPVGGSIGFKGNRQVRRVSLSDEDLTVAQVLQKAGYRTGLVGKWHLGAYDSLAGPMNRGFDEFYGWLIRVAQSHGYYPSRIFRDHELIDVPGNQDGNQGSYSTDMYTDEAISCMTNNRDHPFFLYLSYNNPHSPLLVPDLGPYENEDWTDDAKVYAAMIHRLDQNISRIMQTLKDLGIDENTIVFFCSDNGPRSEPTIQQTAVVEFFDSNGPLRGYKRDMYEGGIRIPMIVRWPGKISPGSESDLPCYFADILPTLADLAETGKPENIDGISLLPEMLSEEYEPADRFLYWEFFEGGFQQAVRWNQWKAIRPGRGDSIELYNIENDLSETRNVAADHPEVLIRIEEFLKTARTESENWPLSAF
jgi:arylsulfatase A-like enzyme